MSGTGVSEEMEEVLGEKRMFEDVNGLIDEILEMAKDEKGELKNTAPVEEFSNLSQRLPAMLINSGTLMTMAYLLRRGMGRDDTGKKLGARKLVIHLIGWLEKRKLMSDLGEVDESRDRWADVSTRILKQLLGKSTEDLAWITDELLRYAEVLKVLTQARIEQEGGD